MKPQDAINKLKQQDLSEEERKELVLMIENDLEELKKKEPEKYLDFLRSLNEIVRELTESLKESKS